MEVFILWIATIQSAYLTIFMLSHLLHLAVHMPALATSCHNAILNVSKTESAVQFMTVVCNVIICGRFFRTKQIKKLPPCQREQLLTIPVIYDIANSEQIDYIINLLHRIGVFFIPFLGELL